MVSESLNTLRVAFFPGSVVDLVKSHKFLEYIFHGKFCTGTPIVPCSRAKIRCIHRFFVSVALAAEMLIYAVELRSKQSTSQLNQPILKLFVQSSFTVLVHLLKIKYTV